MILYSVHDVLADTWSFPQVSPNEFSAVRDFNQLRSRPGVPGDDLECVLCGSWLPDSGSIQLSDHRVLSPARRSEDV